MVLGAQFLQETVNLGALELFTPINQIQQIFVRFCGRFEMFPNGSYERILWEAIEFYPGLENSHQVLQKVGVGLLRLSLSRELFQAKLSRTCLHTVV